MKTLIKNARIISPGIDLPGAAVEIEGKTITAVYPAGSELPLLICHKSNNYFSCR